MTGLSTTPRRVGGELDVYTALLVIAALVLAVGVAFMAMKNMEHSSLSDNEAGGVLTLIR
jgi:hypothetical protein